MLVTFTYKTELEFSSPAFDHHFSLKILPQNDDRQKLKKLIWRIDPPGVLWHSVDGFGNKVLSGHIDPEHYNFIFRIQGVAEVSDEPYSKAINVEHVLLYSTELTQAFGSLVDFYKGLASSAPADKVERLQYFSNAVHNHMRYEKGITTPKTTAQQAFDGGVGVCQDYTHILLALLRLDGVLCRYVAGLASDYGETHAWAEALVNDRAEDRFYGLDPTRNKLIDHGYLALSRGRDFSDCSIERGLYKGACTGKQKIDLRMEVPQ
jgi:transglutaminase-like putative cysteine protease